MTAFHVAGHAVVGRVLDLVCGNVTIIPSFDDDSAGCAKPSDVWDTVGRWMDKGRTYSELAALRARIIASMAGAEAEIEWCGRCSGGDGEDRWETSLMLNSLLPPAADGDSYEFRLRTIARGLVRRHRTRIGLVAAALLVRKTLTDAEVIELMAGTDAS